MEPIDDVFRKRIMFCRILTLRPLPTKNMFEWLYELPGRLLRIRIINLNKIKINCIF